MDTKVCVRCKQEKPLSEFSPESRPPDGRRYSCKECNHARARAYHAKNRDRRNAEAVARRAANPERDRQYHRTYRQKFVDRTLLMHARKRARKFGMKWDLDDHREEIKARVAKMRCEMTGIPLVNSSGCGGPGQRFFNTISLDRINPKKGYVYSNVRIVCWAMNAAMGTWGEKQTRVVMTAWLKR